MVITRLGNTHIYTLMFGLLPLHSIPQKGVTSCRNVNVMINIYGGTKDLDAIGVEIVGGLHKASRSQTTQMRGYAERRERCNVHTVKEYSPKLIQQMDIH